MIIQVGDISFDPQDLPPWQPASYKTGHCGYSQCYEPVADTEHGQMLGLCLQHTRRAVRILGWPNERAKEKRR